MRWKSDDGMPQLWWKKLQDYASNLCGWTRSEFECQHKFQLGNQLWKRCYNDCRNHGRFGHIIWGKQRECGLGA